MSGSRLRRSLLASMAEGVFAEVVGACSGGAVLVGWALHLGCSPFVIGLLGALPFLSQLVQIPAVSLTSRWGARRTAIVAVAVQRQLYLALAVLPFLSLPDRAREGVLLSVAGLTSLLGVVGNNAWVAWMGDLVPASLRGRYFGRRSAICAVGSTVASLAAGLFLDGRSASAATEHALSLLALCASGAGVITTALMTLQHDPRESQARQLDLRTALAPLGDLRLRPLLAYLVSWNAAVGLAQGFFTVHMLQNLHMGFARVAAYSAGAAIARAAAGPLWGKAADRAGAARLLALCSAGLSALPLFWLVAAPDRLWPLAFEAAIGGALSSGQSLAVFTLPLALAPAGERRLHLAVCSSTGGLTWAAAAALGGAVAGWLPPTVSLGGRMWFGLQALFVASAALRAIAALSASRVREEAPSSLVRAPVPVPAARGAASGSA